MRVRIPDCMPSNARIASGGAERLQVYLPNRAKRNWLRVTATHSMINCGIGDFR
jgi:hypothetical protein